MPCSQHPWSCQIQESKVTMLVVWGHSQLGHIILSQKSKRDLQIVFWEMLTIWGTDPIGIRKIVFHTSHIGVMSWYIFSSRLIISFWNNTSHKCIYPNTKLSCLPSFLPMPSNKSVVLWNNFFALDPKKSQMKWFHLKLFTMWLWSHSSTELTEIPIITWFQRIIIQLEQQ